MCILNVVCAIVGLSESVGYPALLFLIFAAGSALVHALGTSQAATAGMSVRRIRENNQDTEFTLNKIFDKFARWSYVRGVAGVMMFSRF